MKNTWLDAEVYKDGEKTSACYPQWASESIKKKKTFF